MSAASAICIPLFDPVEEFKKVAYKAIDRWVEKFRDFFERGTPPTILEISERFSQTKHLLLEACFEGLIKRLAEDSLEQVQAKCPKCGRLLPRKRLDAKKISTLHGSFTIKRPYFYCRHCKYGFHPLDEILELVREAHQLDLQSAISPLVADLPYETACRHFSNLTGIDISEHFSHETLNAIGETAGIETVIPERAEIERKIEESSPGDTQPVLVMAVDGAHMPTRPRGKRDEKRGKGRYKEAKGFRLYLVGADERIVHIASWHQIKDISEFERDIAFIASRIPVEKVKLCLLGDGAPWIWNLYRRYFPEGTEVLDYYHCSEHVYETALLQYGETLQAREWAESVLARLGLDMAGSVIAGLKRMKPVNEEARKSIVNLIRYLETHRDRFKYKEHKKKGFPVGSGGIESSNRFICHTRIKRAGAWWLEENCNAMLRVRCAIYNDTFDKIFEKYKQSKVKSFK